MKYYCFLMFVWMLASCAPAATPTPEPIIRIHTTSSTLPWLADMYPCAEKYDVVLEVDNSNTADVNLRLGESADFSTPAFQLGEDEVLVVTHPQTGVGTLTLEQTRAIYSGQFSNWNELGGSDLPIEVWTYGTGEDIQQIFDQAVLNGLKVISSARVAVSAQLMSDHVGANPGAIGFLPRRWKTGNTHETLIVATSPVLAFTRSEPQDNLEKVLSCLQK
jgi:hypothetical protein